MKKEKMYAQIGDYSKHLVVPIDLLERIVQEGFLVRSGWDSSVSKESIQEAEPITNVKFVTETDLRVALSVSELKGK